MADTKSSRTKMLEQQPENFWQKLSASFSRGLDKLGITQEEAYKKMKQESKTKEEEQAKMAKGGLTSNKKIEKVMGEFKDKKLKSSSGQKVTNRKQAIAIALSEAGKSKKKPVAKKAK